MDCAVNGGACQLAGRAVGVCEVNESAYVNGSGGGHMSMGRWVGICQWVGTSMGRWVGICQWVRGWAYVNGSVGGHVNGSGICQWVRRWAYVNGSGGGHMSMGADLSGLLAASSFLFPPVLLKAV